MCFWLSTRTRKEGTFTICLPTLPSQRSCEAVCEIPLWRCSIQPCSGRLLGSVSISHSVRLQTLYWHALRRLILLPLSSISHRPSRLQHRCRPLRGCK